ncbi:hypothetical protein C8R46DRAFT_1235721 [Mycena filopes]|nr:hypothetical protein C8R46DRAFT_1235721 [Mycena filopes]
MNSPESPLMPIAIVGIAVDMPSGATAETNLNHEQFFDFLLKKKQAYEEFPTDRKFDVDSYHGPNLGQVITRTGCFLKEPALFDPTEFGITPKDARAMALATRKLIETSFLAFLDSGIDYRGRNVGCYISAIALDTISVAPADVYEPRGSFAGNPYMVANKVSYHLDLLGPSIPVDTACSSTLTALHLAVQALRAGDCESAVVGGYFIQYSQGGVLSPDGQCKPFDISADGFGRGEGVGAVILKPLEAAIRDGDYIYATVLGTGVNSTGAAGPVSAPVAESQVDAMRRAYAGTGRHPSEVDYIELHATGTAAGDPTEANWAGVEFRRDGDLRVGSVKGNVGHLEIVSFIASLSKVCSILTSGIIPPTANLKVPNPAIHWEEYRLKAPVEPTPLNPRHPTGKGLISMSSSGIGGSNGHVVLEGPPTFDAITREQEVPVLFVAGGLTPRSAAAVGDALAGLISSDSTPRALSDLSATYGRRARQMNWRSATVYIPQQTTTIKFPAPRLSLRKKPSIVFVFSGQGPQYFDMGRQLFKQYPAFRESIERMDQVYTEVTGASLVRGTGLFAHNPTAPSLPDIWPVAVTLPALAMLQMALCDLLAAFGIRPDAVIGHSAGETPALYACGAATQAMAMRLAIARGVAMSAVEGAGTMAAVDCDSTVAEGLINEVLKTRPESAGGTLEIACFNAANSVTLSGTVDLIDQVVALSNDRGFLARKLRTKVPFHSSLLEATKEEYQKSLGSIFGASDGNHTPRVRTYSTCTGALVEGSFDAAYFWSNTRMPVQFSRAMEALLRDNPKATFIEISPHPVLASYIASFDTSLSVLAPMRRTKTPGPFHELAIILSAVGELVVNGHNCVNFAPLVDSKTTSGIKTSTPAYPFARKHVSFQPDSSVTRHGTKRNGPLNGYNLKLNAQTHPGLAQHVIMNEPIMPAAGYLEMAFEFDAKYLWNVTFEKFMQLLPDRLLHVQVSQLEHSWKVHSSPASGFDDAARNPPRLHAQGFMSPTAPSHRAPQLDLSAIRDRCEMLDIAGFYKRMAYFAQYGKAFQRVTSCFISSTEGLITIKGSDDDLPREGKYHLHPVILDSCINALVHPIFTRNADTFVYYLPSSVKSVTLHAGIQAKFLTWDLSVTDGEGVGICTLTGLRLSVHSIYPHVRSEKRYKLIYQAKSSQQRRRSDLDTMGTSLQTCTAVLRDVFDAAVEQDKKRLVRVLLIHAGCSSFEDAVRKQIAPPSSVSVDFTVGTLKEEGATNESYAPSDHLRRIRFDPNSDPEAQGLVDDAFDIILAFDIASHLQEPSAFMTITSRLLQPGGYLIFSQSHSQDSEVDLKQGPFWRSEALDGSFVRAELYPDAASDAASFTLEAQKSSLNPLPWNSAAPSTLPTIVEFTLEDALHHQQVVRDCDAGKVDSLWISALSGPDGGSAVGFSRALRREINSCAVYLVLFDPIWTPHARRSIIGDLSGRLDTDYEVLIDAHGYIHVPRIVECPLIATKGELNFDGHWLLTSDAIQQSPLPSVPANHVQVRITDLFPAVRGLKGFIGRIEDAGSTSWSHSDLVLGVVDTEHVSNYALVHGGQIISASDPNSNHLHAASAVPLVVLALALGPDSIRNPARLRGRRFLVTHADEPMGQWITAILLALGVVPEMTTAQPTDVPPKVIAQSDYIFSGFASPDDQQVLKSQMSANALAGWWNTPSTSAEIRRNPWIVGDSLAQMAGLDLHARSNLLASSLRPEDLVSQALLAKTPVQLPLFSATKAYLLVGGIGSLGLRLALWMYQHGARHIILTSRSGEASLVRAKNTPAIRLLAYVRALPDLTLRLEECDAASASATSNLVKSISIPLGGCMLVAMTLSNRTFTSHTDETFYVPFAGKIDAFRALQTAVAIDSLDFLLVLSSVTALFGSPGQTNYSGANTALEALIAGYPNAFSIIAPAILDSNFVTNQENLSQDPRVKKWSSWGITSQQLFECLEDAIIALNHGATDSMYLPAIDWEVLERQLGSSPMYAHFLKAREIETTEDLAETRRSSAVQSVRQMVIQVLDIDPAEFSPEVPLTSYGLDSLSAGRLSFMLRPYLNITQVQLLGDMRLADLNQRIETAETQTPDSDANSKGRFDWSELNQSGQTVVQLVEGEGNPLIVIHETSGNIAALYPLQERFTSPLWAIQTTPETPLESLPEMAAFYFEAIKALRPVGPYRLAGFSGGSIVMFHLALLFERNGDEVAQLVALDHFPTLYAVPEIFEIDEETASMRAPSAVFLAQSFEKLSGIYQRDPTPSRQAILAELAKAFAGLPVLDHIRAYHEVFVKMNTMIVRFALDLLQSESGGDENLGLKPRMERWMSEVKAPVTVVVATKGMVPEITSPGWADLGCRACFPAAKVVEVNAGHFSVLEMDETVAALQDGW